MISTFDPILTVEKPSLVLHYNSSSFFGGIMTTIQYPMSSKSIMSDLTLDYRVSCPFSVWKKRH